MIQISLTQALAVYTIALGAIVLAIWIYTEVVTRQSHRRLGTQFFWRCVFCGYSYLDEDAEEVSRCPRCDSFVAASDRHAREIQSRKKTAETFEHGEKPLHNPSRRKRPHQRRRGPRRHR
jgi:DNA-directed RNA polymerase subunit RPC12/RpoP